MLAVFDYDCIITDYEMGKNMDHDEKIKILCRISRCESLQQAVDLAYELLGNPIFITDSARTVLAYTKSIDINFPDWQESIVHGSIAQNMIWRSPDYLAVHSDSSRTGMPVFVTDNRVPFPRIVKTAVINGRVIASVVLVGYFRPLGDEDIDLVELISQFIIALLARARYVLSPNIKGVDNFFIRLLDGAKYDEKVLQTRLAMLDFPFKSHYYVLTVSSPNEYENDHSDLTMIIETLNLLPYFRCFFYDYSIVCLCGSDKEILDWETGAPAVFDIFQRLKLVAGVSQRFSVLCNFKEYYRQAIITLDIGQGLKKPERFLIFDNLSMYHMLDEIPEQGIGMYCHQKIRDLAAYDAKHNTDLCQMLQVYLQTAKNQAKTSELTFVHRNTVHYRIKKCMEILQSDLEDGEEMFTYVLSLRILDHEKRLRHRQENASQ